jgi:hypothetical protein
MHYLPTLVTTLQAAMRIPQPYAFLCATETVQQWPDPPSLQGPGTGDAYIQSWGGSGLVHETIYHQSGNFHVIKYS